MARAKRRLKEGEVISIRLSDGILGYAQVSCGGDLTFFQLRIQSELDLDVILSSPEAFRVFVVGDALKRDGWNVIGCAPLVGGRKEFARYRHQPVGSNQLYVYQAGQSTPATLEEAKDLELFAIWTPEHIEARLKNYFAGTADPTVEFFQMIKKYDPDTGQEIK